MVAAGYLVLQGLWILTVPPFRGIDEFDHAFRAAGAATGQWRLTEPAAEGRGLEVVVPADLVAAASAQCDWLPYPGPDNCFPIAEVGEDQVVIATSAALYHPLWYAAVGQVSRPFDGAAALYAMRIATALVCALGIGVAAWALALGRPGRWTRCAFLAALTPVWVYSSVVPGPNAPEMAAGLVVWTCLLTTFSRGVPRRHETALVWLAGGAGAILATLRMLGPLWLGLIVLSVVAVVGVRAMWTTVSGRRWLWGAASLAVTLAVAAGAWWSLDQGMTGMPLDAQEQGPVPDFEVGTKPLAWTLGMIAAFPLRRETAHPAVYLCAALVLGLILVVAVARSRARVRWALIAFLTVVVVFPVVLTALTVDVQGVVWQGRYQLAWAVGIPIVAGMQLDRVGFLGREGVKPPALALVLLAVAHAVSVWGVAHGEVGRPVSATDPHWVTLPPVVLGATCLLTYLVWGGWILTRTWPLEARPGRSRRTEGLADRSTD